MKRVGGVVVAALLAACAAGRAPAQTAPELLERGVRAYEDLELDVAAGLIRRALTFSGPQALARAPQARALIYLSATELLRERRDSAEAAARRLVFLDPRYRPNQLVFPPELLGLFEDVRRTTKAVLARAPADTAFRPGEEGFAVRLYASSFHVVAAAITHEDGALLRPLYAGPIGDSLDLRWDGLDSTDARPAPGRYAFTVASRDAQGGVTRIIRIPLALAVLEQDTLPHPPPLADSVFLPEQRPFGPALRALAPGALVGAAVAVLPGLVARGEDVSGARYVVSGAVTLGGIVAFVTRHPGRPMVENVARNRARRDTWRRDTNTVIRDNAARRRAARLVVRTGEPIVITPEAP